MKVSCIIPIYNEAERVSHVLDAVVGHELVGEVIVVDDGSTDDSKTVLEKYSDIRLISYPKNRGKSFAVMTGFKESKNDVVMMIDSDLVGLEPKNITDLITPVLEGRADVSISLRKNSALIYKLLELDFVSGERVFHKNIIEKLDELEHLPGFGLETYLNGIIIAKCLRLKIVYWKAVISPRKSKKMGWWQGMRGDYKMVLQILSMLSAPKVVSMIYRMRALRVR